LTGLAAGQLNDLRTTQYWIYVVECLGTRFGGGPIFLDAAKVNQVCFFRKFFCSLMSIIMEVGEKPQVAGCQRVQGTESTKKKRKLAKN